MPSVFLSHTSVDKPFVRRLAQDLELQGIRYWIDEAEIRVGDSLIHKIREGIDKMTHLMVVLSPDSVDAPWVQREVDVAMNQEIAGGTVKVLPLLYKQCKLPGFLLGKLYADFTDPNRYQKSLEALVRSLGVVFNQSPYQAPDPSASLGRSIDRAILCALPLLSAPFHRPFQYIGLRADDVASRIGATSNSAGNLVVESDDCRMYLEVEGAFVSYIEADLKKTASMSTLELIDSEAALGAFSIGAHEVVLVRTRSNFHTYYDHRKKLKVSVCRYEEGMPISVSFSAKYYGM